MGYLRRKKHPWRNGLLITAAALPVLYALGGFLMLPPLVRSQAEKRIATELQRPVSIGQVRINPFALSVTVEQFDVREPDGSASFVGWERLHVNFQLSSLWSHEWRFAAIELDAPQGRVVARGDGQLNFSDLLGVGAAPGEAVGAAPAGLAEKPVYIARLVLSRARLDFRDEARAEPFATTLGPVSLVVHEFRTVSEGNAPYTFEAVTESGEKLSWRGGIRAAPFRSRGELTVSGIVLRKYSPYYADRMGLDVTGGTLTVHGRYDFNFDAADRMLRLLDGAVEIRNLVVRERATGAAVLELPRAEIRGATADGLALTADVRQAVATGGRLRLRRERDGSVNLLNLLRPPAAAATPAAGTAPAIGLTVGEIALREFAFEFEDLVPVAAAKLAGERVHFSLRDFTLAEGAVMPVQLALDWQPAGVMRVNGTVGRRPVAADVQVELDGVALPPFNPYLGEFANVRLTEGLVSLGGRAVLAPLAGGPPAASFEGQAWLERFSVVETPSGHETAGFSDLVVSGLLLATQPRLTARVAEVNLTGAKAAVVVNPDRSLNLTNLRKAPGAAAGPRPEAAPPVVFAAASASAATPPMDVEIGRVVIAGGEVSFADDSVQPRVAVAVAELGGTLTGLSSANPGRGAVDLRARIGTAPVAIAGQLDPLAPDPFVDLRAGVRDFDLRPLSPYSGRYAGFDLAGGRLRLDIDAKLAARRIDTTNVVTLDGFAFGAPTNSPEATKLPVRLGVALLKDTRGLIVIDVPVQGSLDDPEFRIGRVVWRVIGNLLTKAATSPFALLGSMFGGGGDELGWQEFAPGESVLTDEGRRKLAALAKALTERPVLTLVLTGGAARAADAAALRARRLEETLRMAWRERVLAADPAAVVPEGAPLPEEERFATVKHAFDRRFPPGSELGTPLPPAPPILAPPPREDRHWIRKVVDWVTNKEERRLRAFRLEQEEIQRRYLEEAWKVVEAGLPEEVMVARLAAVESVDEAELAALAEARLNAVQDYLVSAGVGLERLNRMAAGAVAAEEVAAAGPAARPRVNLQLQ